MKFSIATPVLNGMPSIRRCVGSVRGQGDVAVQHIIQDGGSTDGTAEWLRTQPGLDTRNEPDAGIYDAINKAWAHAAGAVLSWLNADEQYLPGTLSTVARVFDERPDVDAVFGDMIAVAPTGEPLAARREIPMRGLYLRNRFLYAFSCTLFFRRSLLDRGDLSFDIRYRYAGDYDLMLRLVDAGLKIAHLPRYLALFGADGNNLCFTPQLAEEAEIIRVRHGAFQSKTARRAVALLRCAERLAAGCYRRDELAYDFALDEKPAYRRFERKLIGFRFPYATKSRPRELR